MLSVLEVTQRVPPTCIIKTSRTCHSTSEQWWKGCVSSGSRGPVPGCWCSNNDHPPCRPRHSSCPCGCVSLASQSREGLNQSNQSNPSNQSNQSNPSNQSNQSNPSNQSNQSNPFTSFKSIESIKSIKSIESIKSIIESSGRSVARPNEEYTRQLRNKQGSYNYNRPTQVMHK
jgi:hypothetical protein